MSADSEGYYCLVGGSHPKHKTPMPVAWVRVGKSYVSFHHMGAYVSPELLIGVSKELKARMQGKSCFNFKVVDKALFKELEELSIRSFEAFRNAGYIP